MPYKHGQPVIDLSLPFRIASVLCFCLVGPVAYLINFMMFFTTYKNLYKLRSIPRAITVSNHTTFLDPVKIGTLALPNIISQTLLEATVEFPVLGTFTRMLGGVPIPRGKTGYRKIIEMCEYSFEYRPYLHFYPEGECYLYNQQIKNFKTGAFRIAAELDLPVVPIVTVFSDGLFRPWSFWGRTIPVETIVVLDPVYPADFIQRDENNGITASSVKEFAESVRQTMQAEIDRRGGSGVFYRGAMERIKGLNDDAAVRRN